MKKLYYLFCMICAIGAFTACSDDNDDIESLLPVSEIVVPAKVQAGGELIIAGNGFAADCKIRLQNASQSVDLTVSERLSASVSCAIPATLAPGEYTVVLLQSGEWPLRKITVLEEGAENPDLPVTALLFPTDPVNAGEEVVIQGIGFSKNCEINLKAGEELLKMNITVSNTGVRFVVPDTQASGTYPVVLKQDGGEWTIGEITVETKAIVQQKQIEVITEKWNRKGEDHVVENRYTYTPDGKIASIETFNGGDPEQMAKFEWNGHSLTVTVGYYDPEAQDYDYEYGDINKYTLNDDASTAHSEITGVMGEWSSDWTYTPEGYLEDLSGLYLYGMEENYLSYYSDGNMDYEFAYESDQANKSGVDLMGEVLYHFYVEQTEQYYARIAGICGKAPGFLPSSITLLAPPDEPESEDEVMANITYATDAEGYVTQISFDDEHTLEITYK